MKQKDTAQPMKEQPASIKRVILTAIITGVVIALMNFGIQRYTNISYATFSTVEYKSLWIVGDDGKSRILIGVGDEGGFLQIYGKDFDYQKSVSMSLGESGGKLFLNGTKGSVIVTAGDGIYIHDKDGNIISSPPKYAHPDTKENR